MWIPEAEDGPMITVAVCGGLRFPDTPDIDPRYRGRNLPCYVDFSTGIVTVRDEELHGTTKEYALDYFRRQDVI